MLPPIDQPFRSIQSKRRWVCRVRCHAASLPEHVTLSPKAILELPQLRFRLKWRNLAPAWAGEEAANSWTISRLLRSSHRRWQVNIRWSTARQITQSAHCGASGARHAAPGSPPEQLVWMCTERYPHIIIMGHSHFFITEGFRRLY